MNDRRKFDFYETPPWQTQSLLRRQQVGGTICECCVGDGSLANVLRGRAAHGGFVSTNDIDPAREADTHLDAALPESWDRIPPVDWVITNPPFNAAFPILKNALQHAKYGVIFLLRISFMEPTQERGLWLSENPPTRQLILPRWSYKNNGSTDSVTTAWFIWLKNFKPIEIVKLEEKQSLRVARK